MAVCRLRGALIGPLVAALGTLLVVAVGAGVASAHGVPTAEFDAPLPLSAVLAGAALAVAQTAVWASIGDRATPTSAHPPREGRHVATVPTRFVAGLRTTAAVAFAALVVLALADGVVGRQVAPANLATVFVWPVWVHGLALLAVVVGSVWPTLSPWESLYDALVRLEGREIALLDRPLDRLGRWVAVVGFVVLVGVLEPLTIVPRSPELTTGVVAAYGVVMLVGALLGGRAWLRTADPLGVLYSLFGRVSPIQFQRDGSSGYEVSIRPPWRGCQQPVGAVALVVFVVAAVYTVSFDGFASTQTFQTVLFSVRDLLGTGPRTSLLLYLVGLAGFLTAFALVSWLVDRIGRGTGRDWVEAMQWFAPTVLPIAAGYEVAHNYPYVLRNVGTFLTVLTEPIAGGIGPVDPIGGLPVIVYWGSLIGLIVLGHVVAVVAAHRVARVRYDSAGAARRGHLPLVVLMIGYTVLSLWIVSQPIVGS